MSNLLSKAVKNSSWTAIGSLMTAILGFVFSGLTIRWLGESEAGFAIAVTTIIGINNTFSGFGLGTAATRLISRAYEENSTQEIKRIAGVCLSTSLVFGLLGLSIFTLGSNWIVKWSQYEGQASTGYLYCFLLGLAFLFQQITSYFNIFLVSFQRFDLQTKLNTTFMLANGILGITLLKYIPNILTLGFIQLILSIINCLITGFVVTKLLGFISIPSWNQSKFLELWSFGKWVYLTQVSGIIVDGMDKIFLIAVFGSSSIVLYTFPQRIYQTVHGMLIGQASYLFPMLSAQGDQLDKVAEQIEERIRWIVGLLAGLIYSILIIIGPVVLTIMVSKSFSSKASFQFFIFCWMGYIQAHTILPFFWGLSKGDAKGNWIYQMISVFSILPLIILFALVAGFKYAVLGQLGILIGTIYLARRLKPTITWKSFYKWFLKPLYSSLLLMLLATIIRTTFLITNVTMPIQWGTLFIFCIVSLILIPFLEINFLDGENRISTLKRAILSVFFKFNPLRQKNLDKK